MVTLTYGFRVLPATTQALAWSVIFFIASSAVRARSFPVEIRAPAIAVFYACGTLAGGVCGPALFGDLTQRGSRMNLFWGYIAPSALMVAAAGAECGWGVAAEREPLEAISWSLSSVPAEGETETRSGWWAGREAYPAIPSTLRV